ncbi:hypothetical protein FQN60_002349, partial [Etheostoma spectabile]
CNGTLCPGLVPSCPLGFIPNKAKGVCCWKYSCVPKKDVCVFNNHEYQVGEPVPMKPCEKCICSNKVNASSHLNIIDCEPIPCDTNCPVGYEYHISANQCCGTCVQTSCIVVLLNATYSLKPGSIWSPAGNACVKFECVKIANQFITIEAKTTCPLYDPNECIPV